MTNKGWWASVPVSMKLSWGTIEWPKATSVAEGHELRHENCLFNKFQQFIN